MKLKLAIFLSLAFFGWTQAQNVTSLPGLKDVLTVAKYVTPKAPPFNDQGPAGPGGK